MMKYSLNSPFAERIRHFADYKRHLGYPYTESCRVLWNFDQFCAERFPDKTEFDRELGFAWLEMRDGEKAAGHRNRVMVLREFAKYLLSIGESAYLIPISMTRKGPRYVPHIFSQEEIKAFFYGADHLGVYRETPVSSQVKCTKTRHKVYQ